jgi:hypothetical protein
VEPEARAGTLPPRNPLGRLAGPVGSSTAAAAIMIVVFGSSV